MTLAYRIFLAEDDADVMDATLETLRLGGYEARGFRRPEHLLTHIQPHWPGIVISDIRMPGVSGIELMKYVHEKVPEIPVILITGHGDVQTAIAAMKAGAYDFLEKPTHPEYLLDVARRALEKRELQLQNAALRMQFEEAGTLRERLIGKSEVMKTCREQIMSLAPLDINTVIAGETGTGKTTAAMAIHALSPRARKPFVTVNCGALTEENIDRLLFGLPPATAGAVRGAASGTLFLDGLETLSHSLQMRLLQVVEDGETRGLALAPDAPDLRFIAAVKGDPAELLRDGVLRGDLLHRLSVAQVSLPPLRKRKGDVPLLLEHFIAKAANRHNLSPRDIGDDGLKRLSQYHWPGNIRELRNVAERLVIGLDLALSALEDGPEVTTETYDEAMDRFEKQLLERALLQTGARKGEAAALLGIPRKRLYLRLRKHQLDTDGL